MACPAASTARSRVSKVGDFGPASPGRGGSVKPENHGRRQASDPATGQQLPCVASSAQVKRLALIPAFTKMLFPMANTHHGGIHPADYLFRAESSVRGDGPIPGAHRPHEPSLGASWAEMAALTVLLVFYLLVPVGATPGALKVLGAANLVGAIAFCIIMLAGATGLARTNSTIVFTAPFWFRISTATYFGFGSLTPFFANDTTIAYLEQYAYLEPSTLLKVNTVVVFGTLCTLGATMALQRFFPSRFTHREASRTYRNLGSVAAIVAIVGFSAKYLLFVPYQFGAFPGLTLPGVVTTVEFLPAVSIFLLVLWALRQGKGMILIPIALFLLEAVGGLVMGNKSVVMLAAVMFALGALCERFTTRRVLISVVLIAALFSVIIPPVDHVRQAMGARYGSISQGTLTERLEVLASYSGESSRTSNREGVQGSLVRLSYATPAGFAISQYDIGLPGDSYDLWLAVVVPRFLWREKPVITRTGEDFNFAATGSRSSSSSPGLFAEAYWNFGWTGVAIVMSVLGAVLFFLGRYSLWVIQSGNWWHLPVALIAMRTGMRIDGFLVADIIGGVVTIIALHLIITYSLRLWSAVNGDQGAGQPATLS